MCVVCVQLIADWRRELADPSTGEGRRAGLEGEVQVCEDDIQHCKQWLLESDTVIAQLSTQLLHQGNQHDDVTVMNIIKPQP